MMDDLNKRPVPLIMGLQYQESVLVQTVAFILRVGSFRMAWFNFRVCVDRIRQSIKGRKVHID